jgi:hypothetical protein
VRVDAAIGTLQSELLFGLTLQTPVSLNNYRHNFYYPTLSLEVPLGLFAFPDSALAVYPQFAPKPSFVEHN